MQSPEDGEDKQRAGYQVAEKEKRENRVAHHQHQFPRETVHYVPAQGPDKQHHHRIGCKHAADGVLAGAESLAQVQGKQRHDQHKGEVEQEIARPHLYIIGIPELLVSHSPYHICPS